MWKFFGDNAFGTFVAFVFVVYMFVRMVEAYFNKDKPIVDCDCECGCPDDEDDEDEENV